jgi:3-oxoadipate enol-lactonase
MERFEIDGPAGRLRGWVDGPRDGGPLPVLFAHPINLQGACWDGVAGALEPARFCLLPDLRGHGSSDPGGPYGLEHWAADLLAVLDHFGVERAHVVGGSLGGPLAVYLAAEVPDRVASITAIGAALRIEGADVSAVLEVLREKGVQGMFREVIPEISVAPGTEQAVIERILELANPNDVDTVGAIWGATIASDAGPYAPAVRCPALVLTGEHDKTCTPEQGAEMARRLGTELEIMPAVGHLPMVEAPAALARIVSERLRACDAEAGAGVR